MIKKLPLLLITILLTTILTSCQDSTRSDNPGELSYYSWKYEEDFDDYTVMILEDGDYVPYLVITTDFNGSGNCLLIRKHLLDDDRVFNLGSVSSAAYYNGSSIDNFLSGQYLDSLSAISDQIADTDISIVKLEKLGKDDGEKDTEVINRKVFLLSERELFGTGPSEGSQIDYFNISERRAATTENTGSHAWMLRSCGALADDVIIAVTKNGGLGESGIMGISGTEYTFYVRPAFCMAGNTPVTVRDGLVYIDTAQ